MYIHFCFAASKDKRTLTESVKPSLQFHFTSEDEFKSWLGQALSNMLDLYRSSKQENEPDNLIEKEFEELCRNSKFLELKSWINTQCNEVYKDPNKLAMLKDDGKWILVIKLGNSYSRIVDLINKYKVKLTNHEINVDLIIDYQLNENDRECVIA